MLRFAILFVCLILTACRDSGSRALDPALSALIPADTVALAGARLDQLRATPLYRKLAGEHRLPHLEAFRAETGFDPERDVSELLLAHNGKHGLLMARGRFVEKTEGAPKAGEYRGHRLYGNSQGSVFTFLKQGVAVAGPEAMVRAAIDQFTDGRGGAPAALLARVPAAGQIWAVSLGWPGLPPAALNEMGNAANLDRVLRSVADLSLTASFKAGLHAAAMADCRTDQEAGTLAENLRALASLARLSAARSEPDLQRAFDAIQVRQAGRAIRVTLDMSEDVAERLAEAATKP